MHQIGSPLDRIHVTSPFGPRVLNGKAGYHMGVDLRAAQGSPVYAADDGLVVKAYLSDSYGGRVAILHDSGLKTTYCHLSEWCVVNQLEHVTRGQLIGYSGGTPGTQGAGASEAAHLHFEVLAHGTPVDPMAYLQQALYEQKGKQQC